MAVLVFAEAREGKFKKGCFEVCSYAADLGTSLGLPVHAVAIGSIADDQLAALGKYGVSTVHAVRHAQLEQFNEAAYASAVAAAAKACGAQFVVCEQNYNGRAVAPRTAVKLDLALFSGVTSLVEKGGDGYAVTRVAYTNKAIERLTTARPGAVVSVKPNSYKVVERGGSASISALAHEPSAADLRAQVLEVRKTSGGLTLTEADVVVSAGRGIGSEQTYEANWKKTVGEMAELIGAATACSKPIGDLHLRPHHEHVGQTGVQISPNVYIAVGISGAIQHLAGVSASKTIIVINKDPEAPFFKAADYGIVGDALEIVPRLNEAIRAHKAKQA